jgi:hypothetical protein
MPFGIRRTLWLTVNGANTHKGMTSMYNMLARGGDAWRQRKWRWLGTFNEACTRRATGEASYLDLVEVCMYRGTVSPKGDHDTPAARPAFDGDRCLKVSSHGAMVLDAVSGTHHLLVESGLLPTMSWTVGTSETSTSSSRTMLGAETGCILEAGGHAGPHMLCPECTSALCTFLQRV